MSDPTKTLRQYGEQPRMVTEHFELVEFAQHGSHPPEEDVIAAALELRIPASEVRASCGRHEYPGEWIADRLIPLCQLLETIRRQMGTPLVVVSGYRSHAYNEVLRQGSLRRIAERAKAGDKQAQRDLEQGRAGVAKHSQHLEGRAVDVRSPRRSARELYDAIQELRRGGQLENLGGLGLYREWVHVDLRPQFPGQALVLWGVGLPPNGEA